MRPPRGNPQRRDGGTELRNCLTGVLLSGGSLDGGDMRWELCANLWHVFGFARSRSGPGDFLARPPGPLASSPSNVMTHAQAYKLGRTKWMTGYMPAQAQVEIFGCPSNPGFEHAFQRGYNDGMRETLAQELDRAQRESRRTEVNLPYAKFQ